MSNAPVWGLVFYVNPPVLPPIAPGRGVVGHYIDRCITIVVMVDSSLSVQCLFIRCISIFHIDIIIIERGCWVVMWEPMNTRTDTKLVPINLLDAVIDSNIHMPVDALPSTAHTVHTYCYTAPTETLPQIVQATYHLMASRLILCLALLGGKLHNYRIFVNNNALCNDDCTLAS